MTKKRSKPVKAWGGFVDDKLGQQHVVDGYGSTRAPSIYLSRASARARWRDVRRVEIREISK